MMSDGFTGIPFPEFEGDFTPWEYPEPTIVFSQQSLSGQSENITGSDSGLNEPNRYDFITNEPSLVFPQQAPSDQSQTPVHSISTSNNFTSNRTGPNSSLDEPNQYDFVTDEPTLVFAQQALSGQSENPVHSISTSNNLNSNRTSSNLDEPNRYDSIIDERKRKRMKSNRESARRSRIRKQKHLDNLRNQLNGLKMENRELMNRLCLVTHNCQLVQGDNSRLRSESGILRQRLWAIRQILVVRQLQQQLSSYNNFGFMDEQISLQLIS